MSILRRPFVAGTLNILLAVLATACAHPVERSTRADLRSVGDVLAPLEDGDVGTETGGAAAPVGPDGSLATYQAYAFAHSPRLRASYEEWRAASERPQQAVTMPNPTVTYAAFVRSVETRVGPQRHKLGLMQWFNWPSRITAGRASASLAAQSSQRQFESQAMDVAAAVSRAYWKVWTVQRHREIRREERALMLGLAEQVQVRMEVGSATLADVSHVHLRIARLEDELAGLDETERAASAELVDAIGAPPGTTTPIDTTPPSVGLPAEPDTALRRDAMAHPRVDAMALMADAKRESIRKARSRRFPDFGVGVDWIITGQSSAPMVSDSGKDAVVLMAALKIPVWQRAVGAAQREAEAQSAAFRARAIATRNHAAKDLDVTLSRIRDTRRRAKLHRTTLVPQAETTYGSLAGSYMSSKGSLASLLMAEQDLLDLQRSLVTAEAEHAVAWAELEQIVGHPVRSSGGDR